MIALLTAAAFAATVPLEAPETGVCRWKFLSVPADSALWSNAIDDRDACSTSFTPDVYGTYTANVRVDGVDHTVTIAVVDPANTAPVAAPGEDAAVDVAAVLQLDGTASSDADGDPITCRWKVVAPPASSSVTSADIDDRDACATSLPLDVAGAYLVGLTVSDGQEEGTATVTYTASTWAAQAVPLAALHQLGRMDDSDPTVLPLHWPGSGVGVAVYASEVTATLRDAGDNYVAVFIDGQDVGTIDPDTGLTTYPLASGLEQGLHTVELRKRTGVREGDVLVTGLTVTGVTTTWPAPAMRLEFYGDSITEGYSILCASNVKDADCKDHTLTFAQLTADALDAEHHAIAVAGLGLVRSRRPYTLADIYDQTTTDTATGPWDMASWEPDAVVVSIGQNDYSRGADTGMTGAYLDMLAAIHAARPGVPVVLALGPMSAVDTGSPMPDHVEAAAAADTGTTALIWDPNGPGNLHPIATESATLAADLIELLGDLLGE